MAWRLLPDELDDIDFWDFDEEPMFTRCKKACGKLQYGECYGFFPSLGTFQVDAKTRMIEYIQRVNALEHFCEIAQLKDFHLMQHVHGENQKVRKIG